MLPSESFSDGFQFHSVFCRTTSKKALACPWMFERQVCWPMWLCGVAFLLAVFYFVDRRSCALCPLCPLPTCAALGAWKSLGSCFFWRSLCRLACGQNR